VSGIFLSANGLRIMYKKNITNRQEAIVLLIAKYVLLLCLL